MSAETAFPGQIFEEKHRRPLFEGVWNGLISNAAALLSDKLSMTSGLDIHSCSGDKFREQHPQQHAALCGVIIQILEMQEKK